MVNNILEQTLLCAITQVQRATKNECSFCKELYHEDETWLQCPFFARYSSMKNILENELTTNFKDM